MMKKRVLAGALLFAVLLCVGCAEQEYNSGTSSSEVPVFAQISSEAERVSASESGETSREESLPAESSDDGERAAEELLALLPDESECDRSFVRWVGEQFGGETVRSLALAVQENGYADGLWREFTGNSLHVLRSLYLGEPETEGNVRLLSLGEAGGDKTTVMTFGGDICFADNYVVMQYLRTTENGLSDCIAPEWFEVMQSADIAVLNNEFAISDRGEPMAGKAYTFRAATEHTALYGRLGVDFVTLANNHVFDFGEEAFLDTLDALETHGIGFAGGGRNAEEAQRPFYYLADGRKIGLISATRAEKYILTPEAEENGAGVFRCYDPSRLEEVIAETKQNCDYVIVFVHWGTEGSHTTEKVQVETAHAYIDAGADLIVGTHAHRLQGIEFYNGKAIFYNLGNFWFDSYAIETGLVRFELSASGDEAFYFLPGMQKDCTTSFELGTVLGREIADHVEAYSADIRIADDGRITHVG